MDKEVLSWINLEEEYFFSKRTLFEQIFFFLLLLSSSFFFLLSFRKLIECKDLRATHYTLGTDAKGYRSVCLIFWFNFDPSFVATLV